MKLHELISRVDFDRIIPILRTYDNMDEQIIHYKEAFNELKLMIPNESADEILLNKDSLDYISVTG